jgi:hypothetical protein
LYRVIKCDQVKVIYVPQYESLKLEAILEYAMTHKVVVDSLPPMREIWKLPRGYTCNIIFTCLGDEFQQWVVQRCLQRNIDLANDKALNIKLDANIAKAFHASTAISCKLCLLYLKFIVCVILTLYII